MVIYKTTSEKTKLPRNTHNIGTYHNSVYLVCISGLIETIGRLCFLIQLKLQQETEACGVWRTSVFPKDSQTE